MKTLVIMPTYNEIDSLQRSVEELRALNLPLHLLIVDDDSPDGTGRLADSLANENTFVLHRGEKKGLGAAYLEAFDWAKQREYELVIEMDADGSHLARDLPAMLAAAENSDLVIGARWIPGGAVKNWPAYRQAISKVGNGYARFMLRTNLHDMTSGYRVFRVAFLSRLNLAGIASRGYAFQVELALRALKSGGVVTEVPITFVERTQGRSKMTTAIVLEALWLVTKWAFYKSA